MLKLKVDEMSCGHCVSTVQKAVTSVDPAAEVIVDLPTGMVTVSSTASESSITDAIRSAGYPVERLAA